jgi:hypothetical protein
MLHQGAILFLAEVNIRKMQEAVFHQRHSPAPLSSFSRLKSSLSIPSASQQTGSWHRPMTLACASWHRNERLYCYLHCSLSRSDLA